MIPIYTILIVAAILMQAYFTASEMALTSVNRIRLKQLLDARDNRAARLNEMLHREGAYLGATLVGTNIAVVIASVLATRIFAEYFGAALSPLLTTLVMVPVTLIFAEIVPKIIARQFSMPLALWTVFTLDSFSKVFHPLIVMLNFIAGIILAPFGTRKTGWDVTFTKGDLKRILVSGHAIGEVEADEVELIHKVLDFGAKRVERIMVPLFRVSSIGSDDSIDNLKRLASLTGFSRVPVYDKNKNNIVGIVNIYDILFLTEEKSGGTPVSEFIREPVYVNRKDGLDIALARLRHAKQPMGIVTEEGEKIVGIVTIEDILEEIVGEIEDTGAVI